MIGNGNHRVLDGITRSLYVAIFGDVRTRGRSGLIEREADVLLDFEGEELGRTDDQIELDAAVFTADAKTAWIIDNAEPDLEIEEV